MGHNDTRGTSGSADTVRTDYMNDLTGFQRDLLFVISGGNAPSGQEIRAELERSQERNVQHSRLYANLDRLVEGEFIEKNRRDGRTNQYTATEDGRRVVRNRYEWEERYLQTTVG